MFAGCSSQPSALAHMAFGTLAVENESVNSESKKMRAKHPFGALSHHVTTGIRIQVHVQAVRHLWEGGLLALVQMLKLNCATSRLLPMDAMP